MLRLLKWLTSGALKSREAKGVLEVADVLFLSVFSLMSPFNNVFQLFLLLTVLGFSFLMDTLCITVKGCGNGEAVQSKHMMFD